MRSLKALLADALELALLENASEFQTRYLKEAADLEREDINPFDERLATLKIQTVQQYTRFDRVFTGFAEIPIKKLLSSVKIFLVYGLVAR